MDDHVYKNIEITGTSAETVEDAIRKAIARAGQTVQNMRWFEVVDTRGTIEDGRVARWQVTIKVGFTLND
jgi:flavin-binding protein dodecin